MVPELFLLPRNPRNFLEEPRRILDIEHLKNAFYNVIFIQYREVKVMFLLDFFEKKKNIYSEFNLPKAN